MIFMAHSDRSSPIDSHSGEARALHTMGRAFSIVLCDNGYSIGFLIRRSLYWALPVRIRPALPFQ